MPTTETSIRVQFFDYLFGESEGYICIALGNPDVDKKDKGYFKQSFFKWPENRNELGTFVDKFTFRRNVWFCTSLLERPERTKEYCLPGSLVWADLDSCHPSTVEPTPSAVIESSPDRFQAFWRLNTVIEPYKQEDFSKRIAYKYKDNGVDPSGWDLTQLLRVPLTYNYKYTTEGGAGVPKVELLETNVTRVPVSLFESIERPDNLSGSPDTVDAEEAMPDLLALPPSEQVLYKYFVQINNNAVFKGLYQTDPKADDDWSRLLWRLLNVSFEMGMDEYEVFSIAMSSKCNKYARDHRPMVHLWEDVLRASQGYRKTSALLAKFQALKMPELVTSEEIEIAGTSFIDTYRDWAAEATDAVVSYHDLSAFMLLSSVIASGVTIKANFGELHPNLWGLVLGDSTLSRKTTAMRMAMDILVDIDQEVILATDGSAEGLLSGLATRPNRVSLYFRDEVSGFFDAINRKDYLAGMPELLAQLYDVPRILSRRLRKETISISSPVFVFFGGGIHDKVLSLVNDEYILSGFLPRFVVVSGEADLSRIKRTGPAVESSGHKRAQIQEKVADLYERYNRRNTVTIGGVPMEVPFKIEAVLTTDAWKRYGDIEEKLVKAAYESSVAMLALPTFQRLAFSMLKMATLLAAARETPQEDKITVTDRDIVTAASFIQDWGRYSVEFILGAGQGTSERQLNKILKTIENHPEITRSAIMQKHHLMKREMDEIISTLIDRQQITSTPVGRGHTYKAV